MVATARCPDRSQLERFLRADLPDEDASGIESHLESCDSCASSIHEISSEDPLMKGLRGGPPGPTERQVDTLAERFCRGLPGLLAPGRALETTDLDPDPADPDGPGAGMTEEVFDFLAPAEGPGEIGRLGPYRVTGPIGAGGMGIVFRAEDPLLRRPVALKVMKRSLSAGAEARRRFLREAQAVAALDHDHVVAIYQAGEDRGVLFLAMPLLRGETLADRLRREGSTAPGRGPPGRPRGRRGAGRRASPRAGPPRHQAGEPLARRRPRPGEDPRLRPVEEPGAGGRPEPVGPDRRHAALHEPRAGKGRPDHAALRPLQPRLRPLSHDHGTSSLRRPRHARGPHGAGRGDARAARSAQPGAATGRLRAHHDRCWPATPRRRPGSARAVVEAIEAIERSPSPAPAPRRRLTPIGLALLVVLGLAGAGAAFGPQVVRILTDQGQLVIETSDPEVRVEVKRGGRLVTNRRPRLGPPGRPPCRGIRPRTLRGEGRPPALDPPIRTGEGGREVVRVTMEPIARRASREGNARRAARRRRSTRRRSTA